MIDNQVQIEQKLKDITDFDLRARLTAITHLVDKRKQLDKDQEKEIREIEKKYNNVENFSSITHRYSCLFFKRQMIL